MNIPDTDEEAYALLSDTPAESTDDQPTTSASTNLINYLPTGKSSKPTIIITKSGAFIKFDYLDNDLKLIKKIENYFTARATLITGAEKRIKSCITDKTNKRIIVPRFGIFELLNRKYGLSHYNITSQIKPGQTPTTPFEWKGKLTHNQEIIANHMISNHYSKERVSMGSAGLVLNLEAGQGKSYLAAYFIARLQKKTAIILHSTSLIEQWVKVLKNSLGPDIDIGYYYGKKHKLGDVTLMIIDSATHKQFTFKGGLTMAATEYYSQFGFVIYDECHTYANKYSLQALKSAQAPYMLGLSATPDENSMNFDKLVWWELGPILVADKLPGYISTLEDFKATIHRVMYYGPASHTKLITNEAANMVDTPNTISMLCDDSIRSAIVVDCIHRGLDLGLNMFVFADRREYLNMLRDALMRKCQVMGEIVENKSDFVRIVGGSTTADLENAEISSKVIFTTYQFMGTGKSVVKMTGLVLATPRRTKMKQYINRIFRLGSDATIERHIWDICDMKIKFSSQWNTRKLYYNSKNYTIESEKVKYENWEDQRIVEPEIVEYTNLSTPNPPIKKTKSNPPAKQIPTKKVESIISGIMKKLSS